MSITPELKEFLDTEIQEKISSWGTIYKETPTNRSYFDNSDFISPERPDAPSLVCNTCKHSEIITHSGNYHLQALTCKLSSPLSYSPQFKNQRVIHTTFYGKDISPENIDLKLGAPNWCPKKMEISIGVDLSQ